MPEDRLEMVLAIHCPAILFPFARKIVADATQDAGFQPLMIDPIDFGVLYAKKIQSKD
jgi:preprotein translocase subunit SecB